MKFLAGMLAAAMFAGTPLAAMAEDCQADLADAHQRIAAIQARDPAIDDLVKKHDIKGACEILGTNMKDMTSARDSMSRCLTGFDRNEEVSELNANLADLNDALNAHCR
jgi:hypothetical protein